MEKLRLHLMEQPLILLTPGQVTHEANESPLPFERYLADRKLHWEGAAVLSLADDDAPDADDLSLSGGSIMIQIAVMLMTVRCRHQHADIVALNLTNGESEEALRSCTKGLDCSSLINDHHRVRRRSQEWTAGGHG